MTAVVVTVVLGVVMRFGIPSFFGQAAWQRARQCFLAVLDFS